MLAQRIAPSILVSLALLGGSGAAHGQVQSPPPQRHGIRLDTDEAPPDPRDRRLWFLIGGSGNCVVLLHALGGSDEEWNAEGTRLTATHRVLVVDLPGHGQSKRLSPLHLDGVASQVVGLMRETGCAPAVIIGHSIGGNIAARVALADPNLVRGLVVIDSPLVTYPFANAKERDAFAAQLKRNHRAALEHFYGPMSQPSQVKALVDAAMKVDPAVLVDYLWAASSEPFGDRAAKIKVPTLAMISPELVFPNLTTAQELTKIGFTMPGARLEKFPAAKHWLQWDEPAHFDKVLDKFLDEIEPVQPRRDIPLGP